MSKEEFPHEKDLKDEVTPDKAPKKDPKAAPKEEVKENPVENYEKEANILALNRIYNDHLESYCNACQRKNRDVC